MSEFQKHVDVQLPLLSLYHHLVGRNEQRFFLFKDLIKILYRNQIFNQKKLHIHEFASGDGLFAFMLLDFAHYNGIKNWHYSSSEENTTTKAEFQNLVVNSRLKDFFQNTAPYSLTPQKNTKLGIAIHACDTLTDTFLIDSVTQNVDFLLFKPCCYHALLKHNRPYFMNVPTHFKNKTAALYTDYIRYNFLIEHNYLVHLFENNYNLHQPPETIFLALKNQTRTNTEKFFLFKNITKHLNYPYLELANNGV